MNLRLPGQYFDAETGLHDNVHRTYDPRPGSPNKGRYLTPDPLGYPDGDDPYAYVAGDPVNRIDPLGLHQEDIHYYMTFFLALAAGVPYDTARTIALADQYVDDDPDTWPLDESNPLNNLVHNADAKRRLLSYHFVLVPSQAGADGRLDPSHYGSPPAGDHYADPVSDQLNRLSGASFFAPNDCAKYQLFGEYLHAFEDTFAHRDWNDQAYGINMGIGHGIDLKNPDYTYDHQDIVGHQWHNGARTLEMEKETFDKLGAFGDGGAQLRRHRGGAGGLQRHSGEERELYGEDCKLLQKQLDAWVITDKKGEKGHVQRGGQRRTTERAIQQRRCRKEPANRNLCDKAQAPEARELSLGRSCRKGEEGCYMKFTAIARRGVSRALRSRGAW